MRGEEKCEPKENDEAKDEKVMTNFKLQSNLMFEGKGKKYSNLPIHSVCHNVNSTKERSQLTRDKIRIQEQVKKHSVATETQVGKRDEQKLGRSMVRQTTPQLQQ